MYQHARLDNLYLDNHVFHVIQTVRSALVKFQLVHLVKETCFCITQNALKFAHNQLFKMVIPALTVMLHVLNVPQQ